METLMTLPPARQVPQLELFGERAVVPSWNDLNESMRSDVVKLVAQLLINVRTSKLVRVPREQGGRDE
jgi:hypothetical protein